MEDKHELRLAAIDAALKLPNEIGKTAEKVVADAEKIHDFLNKDSTPEAKR